MGESRAVTNRIHFGPWCETAKHDKAKWLRRLNMANVWIQTFVSSETTYTFRTTKHALSVRCSATRGNRVPGAYYPPGQSRISLLTAHSKPASRVRDTNKCRPFSVVLCWNETTFDFALCCRSICAIGITFTTAKPIKRNDSRENQLDKFWCMRSFFSFRPICQ